MRDVRRLVDGEQTTAVSILMACQVPVAPADLASVGRMILHYGRSRGDLAAESQRVAHCWHVPRPQCAPGTPRLVGSRSVPADPASSARPPGRAAFGGSSPIGIGGSLATPALPHHRACLVELPSLQTGANEVEFCLGHRPFESQQEAIVEISRVVASIFVDDQRPRDAADLDQPMPVGIGAGQT
jgi:hypothetical protein